MPLVSPVNELHPHLDVGGRRGRHSDPTERGHALGDGRQVVEVRGGAPLLSEGLDGRDLVRGGLQQGLLLGLAWLAARRRQLNVAQLRPER